MASLLKKAWTEVVDPLIRRPKRVQVAALCYRQTKKHGKEVLLITSRGQGRWIIPKGWPIDGLDAAEAALQEAWEEAGVMGGKIANAPLGVFEYEKRLDSGGSAICRTKVFPVEVEELSADFPEASERTLKWVSPQKAADMVEEPQLQEILRDF